MTRSHKANDRDHRVIAADGSTVQNMPKFFSKNGFADVDPKKVKKDGGGKGNWYGTLLTHDAHDMLTYTNNRGTFDDDVEQSSFTFAHNRRRSNSFSHQAGELKTKYEVNEMDPVFDESLHGPIMDENGEDLIKTDSSESGRSSN